jgi:hypothetical protein
MNAKRGFKQLANDKKTVKLTLNNNNIVHFHFTT